MSVSQMPILLVLSLLTACGGGGVDEIAKPDTFIGHMFGNWVNINPAPNCLPLEDGSPFRKSEGPMRLTTRTYQESFTYHAGDDLTCANVIALEIQTYLVTWSAPNSSLTKTGAVRAFIDGPTITYNEVPEIEALQTTGQGFKALFYASQGVFESHFSVLTPHVDSDGYPLGTDSPSFRYNAYTPNQ